MLDIKTVTVISANGNMGSGVAAIFVAFGKSKVYMVCRDKESGLKAVGCAVQSIRADSIKGNLVPKTYDDQEGCIKESDLVFKTLLSRATFLQSPILHDLMRNNTIETHR